MTYNELLEMYKEAADETFTGEGYSYKGYTNGNALSLYVNDKFSVNAADSNMANDALCEVFVNQ